jgi:hypothetical protein
LSKKAYKVPLHGRLPSSFVTAFKWRNCETPYLGLSRPVRERLIGSVRNMSFSDVTDNLFHSNSVMFFVAAFKKVQRHNRKSSCRKWTEEDKDKAVFSGMRGEVTLMAAVCFLNLILYTRRPSEYH